MPRRATSSKRKAEEETELDTLEKEATPVKEIEILLPTEEMDKTTESVDANSLREFLQEAFKQMDRKMDSNSETLNKKMEKNNKTLK